MFLSVQSPTEAGGCTFPAGARYTKSIARLELRHKEHNNKHLMTGLDGNSEFCFPRISMFPSTSSREILGFEARETKFTVP